MAETIVNCRVDLGCAIWVLSIRPIGRDSSPDRAGAMRCTRSIWVEHRCRWNREQKCKVTSPRRQAAMAKKKGRPFIGQSLSLLHAHTSHTQHMSHHTYSRQADLHAISCA